MTRLAQSTSCQHCWLMCTDNFIPPPPTPSPFLSFFIWLFISCPPASQPVTCYLSTRSQLFGSWLRSGAGRGGCLKAVLELYSERCFGPLETLKIRDRDSECASLHVCMSVYLCVCAARQCKNQCIYGTLCGHCSTVTVSHQHSHPPLPPSLPPRFFPSSPPCMHTTLLLYPLHLL